MSHWRCVFHQHLQRQRELTPGSRERQGSQQFCFLSPEAPQVARPLPVSGDGRRQSRGPWYNTGKRAWKTSPPDFSLEETPRTTLPLLLGPFVGLLVCSKGKPGWTAFSSHQTLYRRVLVGYPLREFTIYSSMLWDPISFLCYIFIF